MGAREVKSNVEWARGDSRIFLSHSRPTGNNVVARRGTSSLSSRRLYVWLFRAFASLCTCAPPDSVCVSVCIRARGAFPCDSCCWMPRKRIFVRVNRAALLTVFFFQGISWREINYKRVCRSVHIGFLWGRKSFCPLTKQM